MMGSCHEADDIIGSSSSSIAHLWIGTRSLFYGFRKKKEKRSKGRTRRDASTRCKTRETLGLEKKIRAFFQTNSMTNHTSKTRMS